MLRIIAGEQRGRKIQVPGGPDVRPTTDRVREAIFNSLRLLVPGRAAFDLFAGSGALGLEALSRGATHATFVESNHRVAAVLRQNVRHLHYDERVTVVVGDVFHWAARANWPTQPPVVLIAPPYAFFGNRLAELQRLWTTLVRELPDDTVIVLQAPRLFDHSSLPPGQDWELRRYGETLIVIGQTRRESPLPPESAAPPTVS